MAVLRIRATVGDLAGKWLWMVGVSRNGVAVQQPNWPSILSGQGNDLQFLPEWIQSKDGAFRPISSEVGLAMVRLLKGLGIEAELVSEEPEDPRWLSQKRQAAARAATRETERSDRGNVASHSISEKGRDFWRALVEHLRNNAEALERNCTRAIDEKIVGVAIPDYDLTHTTEWSLHIEVGRYSVRFNPDSCQLNLYYRPDGLRIRRVYQSSKEDALSLVPLRDDEIGIEVNGRALTASKFAEETIKIMLAKVNFPDAK